MKYVNPETGFEVDLTGLSDVKRRFFDRALEHFDKCTDWLVFDAFAFGALSPLYLNRTSHVEVLKDPLYLALKDMSLQLGVQQGMVKRANSKEKQARGERWQEKGRGQATDKRNAQKSRNLAPTR